MPPREASPRSISGRGERLRLVRRFPPASLPPDRANLLKNALDTRIAQCLIYSHLRRDAPLHPCSHIELGVIEMTWETLTFVEVKMDAEINSYQEDSDDRF